jgi:hypothetical protein
MLNALLCLNGQEEEQSSWCSQLLRERGSSSNFSGRHHECVPRVGDLVKLLLWGLEGVRVTNALAYLFIATRGGNVDMMHCLVNDLGATVNVTKPLKTGSRPGISQSNRVRRILCGSL